MSNVAQYSSETIMADLIAIVEQMTSDWDLDLDGPIGRKTGLIGDLSFESIDVVEFILAIEEHYKRRKMPFERLIMRDGRYVDEVYLGDAVDFLTEELNKPAAR